MELAIQIQIEELPEGRYTTVPNHPGDMPEGTLRAILKQAGIDVDDFLRA